MLQGIIQVAVLGVVWWTATRLRQRAEGLATRLADKPGLVALGAANYLILLGFLLRDELLGDASKGEFKPFDRWFLGYSADDVTTGLATLERPYQLFYGVTELSLDLVFPLLYALFGVALLSRLRRRAETVHQGPAWLVVLPVAAAVADLAENLCLAGFAVVGAAEPSGLVLVAAAATRGKWLFLLAFGVAVFVVGRQLWGVLVQYAVLVRVPLLTYLVLLAMVGLGVPGRGLPTIENLFVVRSAIGLIVVGYAALLVCSVLGVCGLLTWRQAFRRFGVPRLRVPESMRGWSAKHLLPLLLLSLPLLFRLARSADFGDDQGTSTSPTQHVFWVVACLALSAVLAYLTLEVLAWLHRRRWVQNLKDRLAGMSPRLGAGYGEGESGLPDHGVAIAVFVLLLGFYAIGYQALDPRDGEVGIPAAAYLFFFLAFLCSALSGVTFLLDRYRIPLVLGMLGYTLSMGLLFPRDHYFEIQRSQADPPSMQQALERRLAKQEGTSLADRPLVTVIGAAGGGIQASAWTTQVLTGLQEELGDDFARSIQLISSTSGGSVGAMFYVEGFSEDGGTPPSALLKPIREASRASSLEATAWGILFPDFLRTFLPWWPFDKDRDRAWAIERSWTHHLADLRHSGELATATDNQLWISDWRQRASRGEIPGLVFNSTTVEDGQQFLLSNLDLTPLAEGRPFDVDRWSYGAFDPSLSKRYPEHRFFDIAKVTAARLSATFPYVTPVATARSEDGDRLANLHVTDGGFFDNFGTTTAVGWMRHAADYFDDFEPRPRFLFIQINGFPGPEAESQTDLPLSEQPVTFENREQAWIGATWAPVRTILNVRNSTQLARNDLELELLDRYLDLRGIEFDAVTFRPPPRQDKLPPVSWELSRDDVKQLEADWDHDETQDIVKWMRRTYLEFPPPQVP